MKDISQIRKEYTQSSLTLEAVDPNPIVQFEHWMRHAIEVNIPEPNAMTLATVSKDGGPSSRIVLLKGVESGQFVFYTNYQSRKGKELDHNPACSLSFFWHTLERQVIILGIAERTTAKDSDMYFQTRPRESQVGAWVSPQSTIIKGRKVLDERVKIIKDRYLKKKSIPRPNQWGGYKVNPYEVEFWQGRSHRLHDRIVYSQYNGKWIVNRLAP